LTTCAAVLTHYQRVTNETEMLYCYYAHQLFNICPRLGPAPDWLPSTLSSLTYPIIGHVPNFTSLRQMVRVYIDDVWTCGQTSAHPEGRRRRAVNNNTIPVVAAILLLISPFDS